ncbi:hypothetical protein K8S19_06265 [bacterium]|nr:hypothetical protein [bacterium]
MKNTDLLQRLTKLGFPLFHVDDLQANETIAELAKSHDDRLWEGFPIVLANASKDHLFDFDTTQTILKNKKDYNDFYSLFLISLALYKHMNLKTSWINALYDNIKFIDEEKIDFIVAQLATREKIYIAEKYLEPERLENTFNNYFSQNTIRDKQMKMDYEELSLEYAMSKIFTARQKEIFLKRAHGKKMTKTEREYYYRVIKKKAVALANNDLHILARKAIS